MPNPLCHFEIMCTSPETAQNFYGKVFDWSFDEDSMPGYTLVQAGAEPTGAVFRKPTEAPGPCVNVYFQVDDIEATLKRVEENGGTIVIPNTPIPNVGQFAMFTDPEGVPIGVMQPVS